MYTAPKRMKVFWIEGCKNEPASAIIGAEQGDGYAKNEVYAETLGLSIEAAMNALKIPEDEYIKYVEAVDVLEMEHSEGCILAPEAMSRANEFNKRTGQSPPSYPFRSGSKGRCAEPAGRCLA